MPERYNEELRQAREARNLELKEVARVTRISIRVLEAIEQGNLAILPPAYIRAFLRDYATYLGLDPEQILALYESEKPVKEKPAQAPAPPVEFRTSRQPVEPASDVAPEHPAPNRIEPMKPPRVKRVDTNLTAVIAIGIVLLTGFVLVYFFLSGDSTDKKVHTTTTQAPPPIVPQYTPTAPTEAKPHDTSAVSPSAAFPADSLILEATTSDSVWVSVVADTAHVQRGVMLKGAHARWSAKGKFLLTIGNSRLATFTLNGKRLTANDSTSRVLRNVVVTAATTMLNPNGTVPAALSTKPPAALPKKAPVVPPTKAPLKQPTKPAPSATPQNKTTTPAAKSKTKTPVVQKPKAKPVKPKKIQLKPFPDTIKKVPIK